MTTATKGERRLYGAIAGFGVLFGLLGFVITVGAIDGRWLLVLFFYYVMTSANALLKRVEDEAEQDKAQRGKGE